jgi:hypothetical protein
MLEKKDGLLIQTPWKMKKLSSFIRLTSLKYVQKGTDVEEL